MWYTFTAHTQLPRAFMGWSLVSLSGRRLRWVWMILEPFGKRLISAPKDLRMRTCNWAGNEGYSENRWLILVAVGGSSSSATLKSANGTFFRFGRLGTGITEVAASEDSNSPVARASFIPLPGFSRRRGLCARVYEKPIAIYWHMCAWESQNSCGFRFWKQGN